MAYNYQAIATDADHDPLAFSLLTGPTGMAVDPVSGMATWSPQQNDLGSQAVLLQVDDGQGGRAQQQFTVSTIVAPAQSAACGVPHPRPTVDGNVNTAYAYQAVARDLDGDPLAFSVVAGPRGLTINPANGAVTWSPISNELGVNAVTLQVTDGHGGTATQAYEVYVQQQQGNHAPVITSQPGTTSIVIAAACGESQSHRFGF